MKKTIIVLILVLLTTTLISCGKEARELEVEEEPYDVELTPVLELDWGNGDHRVGYICDEFRASVEADRLEVGPIAFYVDGEESIYIDDSMNFRFVKYDSSGNYVGEVAKSRFIDRIAPMPIEASVGLDCLLLYEYLGNTLYKYDFELDEIKSLRFSDYGIDREFNNLLILYSKQGEIYVCDRAQPPKQPVSMYVIDAQLTEIQGVKEIPYWLAIPLYIDDTGDLYFRGKPDGSLGEDSFYVMNPEGNIKELFPVRQYSQDASDVYNEEDIMFVYGNPGCFYVSDNGVLIERFRGTPDSPVEYAITRNGNAYIKPERYYSTDDKSPFRIYKVEVNWGEASE
ncbi:MAG: hypothetical protein PHY79_22395 [Anaerolineae bacterium]|nr:hypothetical protein [Anaerolineae bacterium]